jgi:hypothetical protein
MQMQIVEEGGIDVQIDGDHNTVTISHGRQCSPRTHAPRDERELVLTDLRATDLVGRETDLAAQEAWLASAYVESLIRSVRRECTDS